MTSERPDNREDIPQKKAIGINPFAWLHPAVALTGLLLLSLFISISVELLWFVLKNQDESHSHRMLNRELSYLSRDFQRRVFASSPAKSVTSLANRAQKVIILDSGLLELHQNMIQPTNSDESTLRYWFKSFWQASSAYIFSATNIILLFCVRLGIAVWSLGLFLLAMGLAFIDGLVQRDLRTFGGDREHPMIQRWIRPYVKPAFFITLFVYLAIPISIHPNLIFVPAAFISGLLVYVSTGNYMQKL